MRRGEIVGLAGLMGAGRTELAMSIFGRSYGSYVSGRILNDGDEIELNSVADAIAHGLAYVSEDRKVLGLNLLDDIKASTVAAKLSKIARGGVVNELQGADRGGGLPHRAAHQDAECRRGRDKLSGGNQQKVVLSKWMFTDPDLLILDEPTRGIDVGAKFEIYGIIQQLAAEGNGVIAHLLRAARAARHLRPHLHDLRRPDHGRHPGRRADPETLMRNMTTTQKKATTR